MSLFDYSVQTCAKLLLGFLSKAFSGPSQGFGDSSPFGSDRIRKHIPIAGKDGAQLCNSMRHPQRFLLLDGEAALPDRTGFNA